MKPANKLTAPNETTPSERFIINRGDLILITGANGFIGPHVLKSLLNLGFCNLRCFVRPTSDLTKIDALVALGNNGARIEVIRGNLLSVSDCIAATKDVAVVIHLAAGRGEKSFPDAFLNSVVTTRNLLEASLAHQCLRRFVNISSFAVYDNMARSSSTLDETCPLEEPAHRRGEAYCFAKVKQDRLVIDYGKRFSIPYVIVRPGYVYGPGKKAISGRVGIDTFGVFLHLGGSNTIPFTYVENCADAIALAGVMPGVDGEVFNVVDDELPSSRETAPPVQEKRQTVYIGLRSAHSQLCPVPVVGVVFGVVRRSVAPGVQPQPLVRQLEIDPLQQPEVESTTGMEAESANSSWTGAFF